MGETVKEIQEQNFVYEFDAQNLEKTKEWAKTSVVPNQVLNKVIDDL